MSDFHRVPFCKAEASINKLVEGSPNVLRTRFFIADLNFEAGNRAPVPLLVIRCRQTQRRGIEIQGNQMNPDQSNHFCTCSHLSCSRSCECTWRVKALKVFFAFCQTVVL